MNNKNDLQKEKTILCKKNTLKNLTLAKKYIDTITGNF